MSTDTATTPETALTEVEAPLTIPERLAMLARKTAFSKAVEDSLKADRLALEADMTEERKRTGGKAFTHTFAPKSAVSASLRDSDDKFVLTNEDAFLEWVEENHPSEVEVVVKTRPAFVTAIQKRLEPTDLFPEGVIDTQDGVAVPGWTFVPGVESAGGINLRFSGSAKDLALAEVAAHLRDGGADELLGLNAAEGDR